MTARQRSNPLAVKWIIYITRPSYNGVVCGTKARCILYPVQPLACNGRVNAMKLLQVVEGVLCSIFPGEWMARYIVTSVAAAAPGAGAAKGLACGEAELAATIGSIAAESEAAKCRSAGNSKFVKDTAPGNRSYASARETPCLSSNSTPRQGASGGIGGGTGNSAIHEGLICGMEVVVGALCCVASCRRDLIGELGVGSFNGLDGWRSHYDALVGVGVGRTIWIKTVRIRYVDRVVQCVHVGVPRLRVVVGGTSVVRIGRHEAAEIGSQVAGLEIVEAGFGVAFFAGEFAGVGGVGLEDALAAEGVIVGDVPVHGIGRTAVGGVNPANVAEGVEAVVVNPVVGLLAGDEQAAEVEIAEEFVAGGVGLDDRVAICAVGNCPV
jgi:hypothetical protein